MKPVYTFVIILFILQNVASANGIDHKEVELKFNIRDADSKNPRYELVFYRNGKKIAKRVYQKGEITLSEGEIPDGRVVESYDSGKIRNIFTYKNGKRNGIAFGFYESGKLKKEGSYLDDNPVGITKMYYENGNLMVESKIVDGKNIYYKDYYENGQLKQEVYYKGDEIIRRTYDIHGEIIQEQSSL